MFQQIRGQGGHLCFQIGPKNTKLCRGVKILLAVKFSWIPFSGFREEVENVSANQRQGRTSSFSDQPENTNLEEDVWIFLAVMFRWNPFSGFRDVENVSANRRTRQTSWFSERHDEQKHCRGWDIESDKFRKISSTNVSANQRPGWQSLFSDQAEKQNFEQDMEIFASCQISLNSFLRLQTKSFKEYLNQSEVMAAILFFRSARKHKLGREHWDLASFHVSLSSIQRLQRRGRKCLSQSEVRAAIFVFRSAKKQTWLRTFRSCLQSNSLNFVRRFQKRN